MNRKKIDYKLFDFNTFVFDKKFIHHLKSQEANLEYMQFVRTMNIGKRGSVLSMLVNTNLLDLTNDDITDADTLKIISLKYADLIYNHLIEKEQLKELLVRKELFKFDDNNDRKAYNPEIQNQFFASKENYTEFFSEFNNLMLDLFYLLIMIKNSEGDFTLTYKRMQDIFRFAKIDLMYFDLLSNDNNLEGVIFNLVPFFAMIIDDFEKMLIKYNLNLSKRNMNTDLVIFKKMLEKSSKVQNRVRFQKDLKLNKSDYYRSAIFNLFELNYDNLKEIDNSQAFEMEMRNSLRQLLNFEFSYRAKFIRFGGYKNSTKNKKKNETILLSDVEVFVDYKWQFVTNHIWVQNNEAWTEVANLLGEETIIKFSGVVKEYNKNFDNSTVRDFTITDIRDIKIV